MGNGQKLGNTFGIAVPSPYSSDSLHYTPINAVSYSEVSRKVGADDPEADILYPNTDPDSLDLRCGRNASTSWSAVKTATINAGDRVGFAVGEPFLRVSSNLLQTFQTCPGKFLMGNNIAGFICNNVPPRICIRLALKSPN